MNKFFAFLSFVLISTSAMAESKKIDMVTLAGGCFWCTEAPYDELGGVVSAISGYTNGHVEDPSYEQVNTKKTGHYEAVQVEYDASEHDFEKILDIFWKHIDPFDAGGQFYDRGPQYQTAIFYHTDEQKEIAEKSKLTIEEKHGKKVATEILPFKNFYPAEDYHQNYYKTNSSHYEAYKKGSGREQKLQKIWGDSK